MSDEPNDSEEWLSELEHYRKQWAECKAHDKRAEDYPYEPRDRSQLVDKHELSTEKDNQ